jgi:predicted amidohydrolase
MDRFYAQYLTLYVIFVNRVGIEDGVAFWGGSEVVAPDGTVVARAPDFAEDLLMAEVDEHLVARERDRNPLIRDERPDIVLAQLMRARGMVMKD